MIKYLELALSQEVYEYLEELDEINWSARGNVLNQYLRNTSIGTTVKQASGRKITLIPGGKGQDLRVDRSAVGSILLILIVFCHTVLCSYIIYYTVMPCNILHYFA
jgi:phage shock protein PspC (stress-responsive transcriptional regulator)